MAYIKNNINSIGTQVITTIIHSSLSGTFTKGSKVKIIGINPIYGYSIEDDEGNKMYEIGWII